jgi:hypothetical protein
MDKNSISLIEKKISCNKQKGYHMNSTNELKLKITHLFGKLNPKNQDGFLNKMKEYDLYSKLDLSEEQFSGGAGEQPPPIKVPLAQNSQNGNVMPPSPRYPPTEEERELQRQSLEAHVSTPQYDKDGHRIYGYAHGSPIYAPASPQNDRQEQQEYDPYVLNSPEYQPRSPDSSPPNWSNAVPISPQPVDDFDLDDLAQFADANEEFLDAQLQNQEKQFVDFLAISEAETIYRRDEIVAELIDNFKSSETSTIFSNDDKLKLWIDELLQLVDNVSVKDIEGHITGIKKIDSDFKPIVENFSSGKGTGVSWVVPVSSEKKKVYDAVNDGSFFYSVDREEELKKEEKIITADPKNIDPETKFRGYDHQQQELYKLGKTSNNTEALEFDDDGTLSLDREVYYFHSIDDDGKIDLGKRVLDKGVYRLENRYENIGKKASKKSEATKAYETLGRKRLVGVEEETIVEPEKIMASHFLVTTPGGKKLKPVDGFYKTERVDVEPSSKIIIEPFRSTREEYVLIREKICTKDPYALDTEIPQLYVDRKSLSVSNLTAGDTIVLNVDIGTIPIPHEQGELFVENSRTLFELDPSKNLATVPYQAQVLAKISEVILGEKREDGLYHYIDPYLKTEKTSVEPECVLAITPILGHPSIRNRNWENIDVYVFAPRISNVIKNDIESVKVGDDVMILLTDMFYFICVLRHRMNFVLGKNPYFISNKENHLIDQIEHITHYGTCEVTHMDEQNITLMVKNGTKLLEVGSEITISRDEFSFIYLSKNKNIEKAKEIIEEYLDDELELEDILRKNSHPYRYREDRKRYSDNLPERLVWAKVINHYHKGVAEYDTADSHLMVQILQPTKYDKVGDFVLVAEDKIEYRVKKYVFENKRFLGTYQTPKDWLNGLIVTHALKDVVPTIQEFINKLSNKLRKKESIHYSFIQDLSNLALRYEKYQLTDVVKHQIDQWMNWNIVKNVEDMVRNYVKVHYNFKDLLHRFETTDELDPNKFRLNNKLNLKDLLDYSSWSVDVEGNDYSGVKNQDLVKQIEDEFRNNVTIWEELDKKELTKYQTIRILEKSVPANKKWDKLIQYSEPAKSRHALLLDSIRQIPDPIIRNKLLLDFIKKYCYLAEDATSGSKWYFSKLDMSRTPLVCPHIYAELTSSSTAEFESSSLRDGSVVCKNCGEVLNTMVFSYFEGYDEEDKIRGRVEIVNGKEVVGTMADTELVIEKTFLFTEAEEPQKYEIEAILNEYLTFLAKNQQAAVFQNVELKEGAIEDCLKYILQYNLLDFETWLQDKKKTFIKKLKEAKKDYTKKTDDEMLEIIRKEKNITDAFRKDLVNKKKTIVLARLAILLEKQVEKKLTQSHEKTIDESIKSEETSRIASGQVEKKSAVIEKFRKDTNEDYTRFISSGDFPILSELYRRAASEYQSEDVKIDYEEKFTSYTDANIDAELTLFDALSWLRFFIRNSHRQQKVPGLVGLDDCVPGNKEYESYGTTPEQLTTIRKLEEFVEVHMPREENRTGVKARKQFYSSTGIDLPELSESDSDKIEANLIIKNLYSIETNEGLMKAVYDKTLLKKKKDELAAYQKEVLDNMEKYRLIDYLVTYILDPNTNKVVVRMFENGISEEEGISRSELIERYSQMGISELQILSISLRNSEIQLETGIEAVEVCTKKPKTDSAMSALLEKILEKLKASLPDEEERIEQVRMMLVNLEKDSTVDKSVAKTEKEQKIILFKEYERLSKMLTYLKRDYNYLVHGANLKEKKLKLAEKTGYVLTEEADLSSFKTEYDYLIKYMDLDYYDDLKENLHSLESNSIELVELLECDETNEMKKLEMRNSRNKFLFCASILRILIQFLYEWDQSRPDHWNKPDKISSVEIVFGDDSDSTIELFDRTVAEFMLDFITGVNNIFRREEATLQGVEDYKERNYEIVKQVERSKRMKHIDHIGSDLIKEFNKVMKGKRVLSAFTKEVSSENGLETAKKVQQENYEEDPNGAGNYGTVFSNNIEGDEEVMNEEDAFDNLD